MNLQDLITPLSAAEIPHLTQKSHCRSEEHTSELQSPYDLVCRLLLEKKNNKHINYDVFTAIVDAFAFSGNLSDWLLIFAERCVKTADSLFRCSPLINSFCSMMYMVYR